MVSKQHHSIRIYFEIKEQKSKKSKQETGQEMKPRQK